MITAKQIWQHKNGNLYQILALGKLQSNIPTADMLDVIIYQGEDRKIWVRSVSEFSDGRFTKVSEQS